MLRANLTSRWDTWRNCDQDTTTRTVAPAGTDCRAVGLLKAGLAAAGTAAIGLSADAFAEKEAEARAQTKQALTTAGVRPIDIHAHYYPESFFDVFIERWKALRHRISQDRHRLYLQEPVGNQPMLPMKFIDLKLRIADMDAAGDCRAGRLAHQPDGLLGRRRLLAQAGQRLERWRERGAPEVSRPPRLADDSAHAVSRPRHRRTQSRQQVAGYARRLHRHAYRRHARPRPSHARSDLLEDRGTRFAGVSASAAGIRRRSHEALLPVEPVGQSLRHGHCRVQDDHRRRDGPPSEAAKCACRMAAERCRS